MGGSEGPKAILGEFEGFENMLCFLAQFNGKRYAQCNSFGKFSRKRVEEIDCTTKSLVNTISLHKNCSIIERLTVL